MALGPRKKIVRALHELRTERSEEVNLPVKVVSEEVSLPEKVTHKETKVQVATNKLITDFFPGFSGKPKKAPTTVSQVAKTNSNDGNKRTVSKTNFSGKKFREIPPWCSIPGTPIPFRVVSSNILSVVFTDINNVIHLSINAFLITNFL